jgi:[pyruvate, water dikinase]-phosphate phosphotransferase / [pyruvate, water dikinase] kinase
MRRSRRKRSSGGPDLFSDRPVVYVVSDSIGETAELVTRAALSQFNGARVEIFRIPYVENEEAVHDVIVQAQGQRCIIVYTLVFPELRALMSAKTAEAGIPSVDIMGPMMDALTSIVTGEPRLQPGLVHQLDEEYFRRVEAIEFAVKYDDGRDPRGLLKADTVLIGVSRTSKTPVCLYLANRGIKVANVPLVPEIPEPEELSLLPKGRVIGMQIDPSVLRRIREERLRTLGLTMGADYADPTRIESEVDHAAGVFRKLGCPVVDVTSRAVEETASRVLEIVQRYNPDL